MNTTILYWVHEKVYLVVNIINYYNVRMDQKSKFDMKLDTISVLTAGMSRKSAKINSFKDHKRQLL